MRKLRIAQVTNLQESVPPLNKNGLEQVVYYLTEELVKMGHNVTVFGTADSKVSAKLVPLWPMAASRDKYGRLVSIEGLTSHAIAAVFKDHKQFDIIHDHSRMLAPLFANLIHTPIVSTVHHPIEPLGNGFPNSYMPYVKDNWIEYLKRVTTVLVSNSQQKQFIAGNSHVIHNGISLKGWKNRLGPGSYIAFLGYITKNKGASEAIQAVLKTKQPLLLAGNLNENNPADVEYFKKEISPFLSRQIRYIGPLNYHEKIEFLSQAKATLMPIQWDEPFGMVAIESLACGTPVIAWNRAAMPEIITDGENGYLVSSIESMTQKINSIDKIRRENCLDSVLNNFTAEIMTKNMKNFT